MILMKRAKLLSKALLSLWIVYNIFTMMVMPNVGSFWGRSAFIYIAPYANTVGLNGSWSFFSPDPPTHTMYLRYFVSYLNENGEEAREPVEGYFPEEKDQRITSPFRQREFYVMHFMSLKAKYLRVLMGPWLCRKYPGASNVDMTYVAEKIPNLDQAVASKSQALSEMTEESNVLQESYSCRGAGDEETL